MKDRFKINKKKIISVSAIVLVAAGLTGLYAANSTGKLKSADMNIAKEGAFLKSDPASRKVTNAQYDYTTVDDHKIIKTDNITDLNGVTDLGNNLYLVPNDYVSDSSYADGEIEASAVEDDSAKETVDLTEEESELGKFIKSEKSDANDVIVAVIDSGVTGAGKKSRILQGANFSATGNDASDDNGHGTQVADAVLTGTGDNVRILPVKVLDSTGRGTIASLYKGIEYAIEQDADIINISLSSAAKDDSLIKEAINDAEAKGITVVAAAGNYGANTSYYSPAKYDSVITVASVDNSYKPASYSNYGDCIDYAAIGSGTAMSGTSLSAAKVSALCAMLKGADYTRTTADIEAVFDKYAVKPDGVDKSSIGHGILETKSISTKEIAYTAIKKDSILDVEDWKSMSVEDFKDKMLYNDSYKAALFYQNLSEKDRAYADKKFAEVFNLKSQWKDKNGKEKEATYKEYLLEGFNFDEVLPQSGSYIAYIQRNRGYDVNDPNVDYKYKYYRSSEFLIDSNNGGAVNISNNDNLRITDISWSGNQVSFKATWTVSAYGYAYGYSNGTGYICDDGESHDLSQNYNNRTGDIYIASINYGWNCKLTVDPNGGTLDNNGNWGSNKNTTNNASVNLVYGKGSYCGLGAATRTDYTFLGWFHNDNRVYNADGNYNPDATYYNTNNGRTYHYWSGIGAWQYNADLTLKAKWKKNEVGITYHSNGGIMMGDYTGSGGNSGNMSHKQTQEIDSTIKLESGYSVERPGYKFTGWSTNGKADGVITTAASSTTDVYAVWEKIENSDAKFVDFNSTKSNNTITVTYTKYKTKNEVIEYITPPSKNTDDGVYTFEGYYEKDSKPGDAPVIAATGDNANKVTSSTYFTRDTTLVARWSKNSKANPKYSINYHRNAPSGYELYADNSSTTVPSTVEKGKDCTVKANGYKWNQWCTCLTFKGWATSSNGAVKYKAGDIIKNVTKNINLYAVWGISDMNVSIKYHYKDLNKNRYTEDPNDVFIEAAPFTKISDIVDKSKTDGEKPGFTYSHYKTTVNYSKDIVPPAYPVINDTVQDSVVIHLYYDRIKCTVELSGDDGFKSISGAGTYEYGTTVNVSATMNDGYSFVHWVKPDGKISRTTRKFSFEITGNVKRIGVSKARKYNLYVVPYASDETGTGSITYNKSVCKQGTPIKVASLSKGETVTVNNPLRDGYNFSSWAIKDAEADKSTYAYTGIRSSGSGATTIKDNVVTMGNRDTYLVAKWNTGTSAYTVNHQLQDIGGKTYTVYKSYKYNAATDTTVTPAVLSLNGFTSPSAVTTTVTGNGKTVINYFYKRHYMTINYNVGHNDKKTAYAGFSEIPHKGADNKFYKKGEDNLIYVSETEKGEYNKLTTIVWYGSESMKIPNIETIGLKLTGHCVSDIDTWKEINSSKKESELLCLSDKANAISFQVNAVKNLIKKKNIDMTVEANWEANRYNLTLNYNYATTKPTGGATTIAKDGNSATWVGFFKYDSAIKNIFNKDKIKRNGYIFNGWYIGNTQFWNVNGEPTVPLNYNNKPWSDKNGNYKWFGNTSVTAKWTPIEWTIKYNANGGTGTMADSKHTYGDKTKKLSKCTFTKTGHTFEYWYASRERKDANGKVVKDADGKTVYEWLYGDTKGDYVNGGNWFTEAEGTEKGYKKFKFTDEHTCSTITYRNNDKITMHAQWKPNTWTVKYDANGGTGTMADSKHTYGNAAKKLSKCTFTRTGYTFNGYWYASRERKDANGKVVTANGKTVYEWLYGDKEGKYVNGANWFTKDEGTKKGYKRYRFPDEGTCSVCTYRINDVITMHAQWTPKKYDLILNYNDATTKPTGGATTVAEDGKSATWNDYFTYDAPINNIFGADKIKRTGYTFNGWFIGGKNGTQFWNANGKPIVPLDYKDKSWSDKDGNYKWDGNTNVTAEWTENSYTIKFDGNKPGTASNEVTKIPASKKVKYTEEVTLNEKPSLKGWTFTGWNTQADGKGKGYKYNDVVSKLSATNNATVTLYAQWKENSYNIVFHGNTPVKPVAASSKVTGTVASMKNVKYEATFNLPKITGTKDAFALTGWKFAGWNRSETNAKSENNYRPVAYNDAQEVQGLSATDGATVNLYAQWDANKYKIHFDKNKPSTSNGYDKDSVASHDVTGEMADVEHTYDIKKALPDNKFKLHGWKFKGWNTKADGTGKDIPNKENVLNLTTVDNATVTLYAQWEATTYTITFNGNKHPKAVTDLTGSMSPQVLAYDKWTNLNANEYILDGWTFDKWNLNADGSSETSYEDKERVRNICDGKDTTLYAQWKDTTPPDADQTYLRATKSGKIDDTDYARALAIATKGSKDVTTSTSVTRILDGLGSRTWTTNWINSNVSIDLYSFDNGSGIKLLTTYSGDKEWNKTEFNPSVNTEQVKSLKYDTTEGTEVFYGAATDNSKEYFSDGTNNVTKTRKLTVKIDKTAPTGTFTVKTGTLSKPLTGKTSLIYDENGTVTGVNADGMRTEVEATISDNGNEKTVSGVNYVWAVVTDMENAGISKTYECVRSSGDKYNGTYVAVDNKGELPNLYSDFGTSRKLIVKVYACDEAGNISVYRDKEPGTTPENPIPDKPTSITPDPDPKPEVNPDNNIITNISIWSQIIRDDKEMPDTTYAIRKGDSNKGPVFLLNQSGKVHIVTYGYVDAVDVNFPPELQAAAQIDVAKGQTVKKLGTIANVDGAYVNGRIQLSGNDCTRITDCSFIVPLYLNSSDVKAYTKNGTKWLDGITNGIEVPAYIPTTNTYMTKKANGLYEVKTINTVTIPYKNTTKVNGATIPYEPSDKVTGDKRSTASFYCAKDCTGKGEISITDKLHTHLVN